ncbi:MAG: UvrD-helicase domain-containing protein [Candidatus Delongbacteria bacterium]
MDLSGLNPAQQAAVQATDGPVLILAGAGSGKTRVLTSRIAWLLDKRLARPWEILALTFTNKAAKEMSERIAHLVDGSVRDMWVGTFHSIFARILRREAEALGYGRNFTIYDSDDQLKVVQDCMERLSLKNGQLNPKRVRGAISNAKNAMLDPETFATSDSGFIHEKLSDIYRDYAIQLKQSNAMDFDDLLLKPIDLFRAHPERLKVYQERFRFLLIDEYQDTNQAQFEVARLLAQEHANICVVGDDDQSIYGWRGADLRNILDFERTWPGTRIFKLEQNYRSTEVILEAAHAVVSRNQSRHPKQLWTQNGRGELIPLLVGEDESLEAALICRRILEHREQGGSLRDVALLYRTNAQSRALEEAFMRHGLRYQIVGGTRFYERREIKDLLAYLRLLVNSQDTVSLLRVINTPRRGIGDATIAQARAIFQREGLSFLDGVERFELIAELGRGAPGRLVEFGKLIHDLRSLMDSGKPTEVLELLLEQTRYIEHLEAEGPEGKARVENVRELQAALQHYEENSELGLAGFLEEVALVADVDGWDDKEDHVTLMTVHSAKGLEFPVVFVTGLEEGLFPLAGALDDPLQLEEERRLFYVAATRAMRRLFLCFARMRRRYGQAGGAMPSTFLDMIPEELLDRSQAGRLLGSGLRGSWRDAQASWQSDPHTKPGEPVRGGTPSWKPAPRVTPPPPPARPGFAGGELELDPGELPAPARKPARADGKLGADRERAALLNQYSPFRKAEPVRDPSSQLAEIADPADLFPGAKVLHETLGKGVIIHLTGFGGETRVSVRFESVGVKKLVARLAKLRLIG